MTWTGKDLYSDVNLGFNAVVRVLRKMWIILARVTYMYKPYK